MVVTRDAHAYARVTARERRARIKELCGAHQAAVGVVDELGVEGGFGFPKKDGGERGGCPGSFGKTAFVIKEFAVSEIGTLDLGGSALGDGEKFLN